MATTKKLCLFFPKSETEKPIIYHLVKDFNLIINIFRAKITPEEEGYLVIDVTGEDEDIEKGIAFVRKNNVAINATHRGLQRDPDRCVHCGNCLSHCPTKALSIKNVNTRKVEFDEVLCIECLACVKNCPFGACYSIF
jgi:ferredoxin